jgi:hypothetical protein
MRIQVYAENRDGDLPVIVHAGAHTVDELNPETLLRLHAEWEAWREKFLAKNPGDCPLRTAPRVTHVEAWPIPIGDPRTIFRVVTARVQTP